jgi:hypothetical protein
MTAEQSVRTLAIARIVIGLVSYLAPTLAGRLTGLDARGNPQAPYLGRLFGVRDVVLGIGALRSQGEERARWLRLGLACDAADLGAAIAGGRAGYLPPATTALLAAPAAAALALGARALKGR